MSTYSKEQILAEKKEYMRQINQKLSTTFTTEKQINDEETRLRFSKDVRIFARIRPMLSPEIAEGNFQVIYGKERQICVFNPSFSLTMKPQIKPTLTKLDHIFDTAASNDDVYNVIVDPLLKLALGGGVGAMIASGQVYNFS